MSVRRAVLRLATAVLAAAWLVPSAAIARTLTFEERVAAQEAIERVYYRHQIGATLPFREAVPRALLERKVRGYLESSVALANRGRLPVSDAMLRAELERIESHTLFPSRLREVYAALEEDPFLVLECFARPVLVERLARQQGMGGARAGEPGTRGSREESVALEPDPAETITVAKAGGALNMPEVACGQDDAWSPVTTTGAPTPRRWPSAVWTGNVLIVWGGRGAGNIERADGGRYDPLTDSWTPMTLVDAPAARVWHTTVWTGAEMIVWGGSPITQTGGRYDPLMDHWTATSTVEAPAGRRNHLGFWTGTEMIVWGGACFQCETTGGRYDPVTDAWTPTSNEGAPEVGRGAAGAWTGDRMVIWGGGDVVTGGLYDPVTDTWSPTSTVGAPAPRPASHTAVWAANRVVIWGYVNLPRSEQGGRYDPVSDTWEPVAVVDSAASTNGHAAVGTGEHMILWSGWNGAPYVDFGSVYDPRTDTWVLMTMTDAPTPREDPAAAWTGGEMIVWGGYDGSYLDTGGRYRPTQTDGDGDGFTTCQDCDDSDACVGPGVPDVCDGRPNDCGSPDWPVLDPDEADGDGDGYLVCGSFDPVCAAPGVVGGGDCEDGIAATFPGAPEINDGLDNGCPGDEGFGVIDETSGDSGFHNPADPDEYSWPPQAGATRYHTKRSTTPDFAADCTGVNIAATVWIDSERPTPGTVFYYLNRPFKPNVGSWGQDSQGLERLGGCL